MHVLKSPARLRWNPALHSVFLAGSIEMGTAPDWQAEITRRLELVQGVILNPRRNHWDPSWPQDPFFPPFVEQWTWEQEALERATTVACFLANDTMSPISLLELGLSKASGRLVVGCQRGFSRYANVYLTCERHGIPFTETMDGFVQLILARM